MSQSSAFALPEWDAREQNSAGKTSRHLEALPRTHRPRVLTATVAVSGITAIFLAPLGMSLVLADGAYRIAEMQREERELLREQHAAEEKLWQLNSTQNILQNALLLGMVPSSNPVFLDLHTGNAVGGDTGETGQMVGNAGNLVGNTLLEAENTLLEAEAIAANSALRLAVPTISENPSEAPDQVPGVAEPAKQTLLSPEKLSVAPTIPSPTTR